MINSMRVKALRFMYGSVLEVVGVLKAWLLGKKGPSEACRELQGSYVIV